MRNRTKIRQMRTLEFAVSAVFLMISSHAIGLDIDTILNSTAVKPPARVEFREERHNQMLQRPIVLTGYLEYIKDGQLRKTIKTPFIESYLITKEFVEIDREGKTRRLSLKKSKAMQALFGGIEAVLAGNTSELSSLFYLELIGTEYSWSLQLKPKSKKLAKQLAAMLVKGNETDISSIKLDFRPGEWSLMEMAVEASLP